MVCCDYDYYGYDDYGYDDYGYDDDDCFYQTEVPCDSDYNRANFNATQEVEDFTFQDDSFTNDDEANKVSMGFKTNESFNDSYVNANKDSLNLDESFDLLLSTHLNQNFIFKDNEKNRLFDEKEQEDEEFLEKLKTLSMNSFNRIDQKDNDEWNPFIDDLKYNVIINRGPPLYWGIKLGLEAFEHPVIKEHLNNKPNLIKRTQIHSTLLYMRGYPNSKEEMIIPFEGKKCKVVIDALGISDYGCALRVTSITCCEEENEEIIPSFPNQNQQHITMALRYGVRPVNSVYTLLGEGEIVELNEDLILYGIVHRYY